MRPRHARPSLAPRCKRGTCPPPLGRPRAIAATRPLASLQLRAPSLAPAKHSAFACQRAPTGELPQGFATPHRASPGRGEYPGQAFHQISRPRARPSNANGCSQPPFCLTSPPTWMRNPVCTQQMETAAGAEIKPGHLPGSSPDGTLSLKSTCVQIALLIQIAHISEAHPGRIATHPSRLARPPARRAPCRAFPSHARAQPATFLLDFAPDMDEKPRLHAANGGRHGHENQAKPSTRQFVR